MQKSPTRFATIVFTDLEDSTRRWEDDPEIMDAALQRHDAILQREITRFGGAIAKHTGDGVLALFDRPADAARAAVAAQVALHHEDWPGAPLRVRIGVHTGEVRTRTGDVFGPDVNLAARIENAAHGGQILVSAATEQFIRDALPRNTTVADLGHWMLRNVHAPQHLFELRHASLSSRFPRPRASRPGRSSLPVLASTYVDMLGATERLASLLDQTRLVTVVGPGGVGKSRLAVEVATTIEDSYADGVRWCPLADVDDSSRVGAVMASQVDLGGAVGSAGMVEMLRSRNLLLLIDNCEHVRTAVRLIVALILNECPDVTVLATSREPLRLHGENVYEVAPLSAKHTATAAQAVTLFLDRASEAGATIDEGSANRARIASLCARLDGLPLAIELAAARTRSLGLDELERRLDERLQLLASSDTIESSLPAHHGTLRDTVAWSYDLLNEPQRRLFERLAVFRGGLTTDAAAEICGDPLAWEHLAELSERSLIQHDVTSPVTRYELLETVRAFALERLAERGVETDTSARHARYFCTLAEEGDRERSGPTEAEWVERELAEVANFRAAATWAVEHNDVDVAVRLYVALYELASLQAHVEIFDWIDASNHIGARHPLGPAALAMSGLRQDLSTPASVELAERAKELQATRGLRMHRLLPWAKGFAEASRGNVGAAADAYRETAEVIVATEGENGHWISARALVVMITRDTTELRNLMADARRVGQPSGLANAMLAVARVTGADDATRALDLTRRAYALAESVQNVRLLAYADLAAAGIAARHAAPEVAVGHLLAALAHAVQARHHEPMWVALTRIDAVLRRAGLDAAAHDVIDPWLDAFPAAAARYPTLRIDAYGDGDFADAAAPSERELCDRTVALIDHLRRDGRFTAAG